MRTIIPSRLWGQLDAARFIQRLRWWGLFNLMARGLSEARSAKTQAPPCRVRATLTAPRYLLMQIAGCVAFARASMHSERLLYWVPWPPSGVTK
jgi:hypothetical protein